MKFSKTLLALAASTMLAGAAFAEGDAPDKKPDAPKAEKKEAKAKPIKLIQPYSLIEASLTAEQKEKLNKIHQEALEETKKVREKEETDSMAVLTDAQKAEIKAAQEKHEAEMKAKKAGGAEKKSDDKKPEEKK